MDCLVKVDELGFFIYWKSENKVTAMHNEASLTPILLIVVQ